ncbi:hypothetical protein ACT4S5_18465 [Kocuria oceani]|uniref:hypothetical protein n=1 Tax=Kocuria oceani TaxID=988827 RepID=UPI0040357362
MTASPLVPAPTLQDPHAQTHQPDAETTGPVPARGTDRLTRYRMNTDRPGLHLRAGEVILGIPYASTESDMVMPVRCESDGHNPGALLAREELEDLGATDQLLGPYSWGKPGVRH